MTIDRILARAMETTGSYGNYGVKPEMVDAETIALGSCKLINQEIELFIRFVFRRFDNGRWLHIQANGQIPKGVWTPWGSSGKSRLTRAERDTVRRYLLSLHTPKPPYPLFFYQEKARRWYVDTLRFSDLDDGLAWLERYKMTTSVWFEYAL